MSPPKKEQFLARWSAELNVFVCHGVGGAFDVLVGKVRRAGAMAAHGTRMALSGHAGVSPAVVEIPGNGHDLCGHGSGGVTRPAEAGPTTSAWCRADSLIRSPTGR